MLTLQLPALGLIAPPPGAWGAAVTLVQSSLVFGRFKGEMTSPATYSKFAADSSKYDDPIPSQRGMFIAYAPASLIALFAWLASNKQNVAACLLFIHFLKRVCEVLFLHKFSGNISKATSRTISIFYSLDTLLIASTALLAKDVDPMFMKIGTALFAVGELGNFYHHYLLTTLRKDKAIEKKDKAHRYIAPSGGLFSLVATPHYLFELVAWLGIAFCAQQANAFIEVLSHSAYLMGRAYQTNRLYFKQFPQEEWPKSRKNIFPFIY